VSGDKLSGGAVDDDLDQLAGAFAVARHLRGEICQHSRNAFTNAFTWVAGTVIFWCDHEQPRTGSKASSVSEVEVSLSMVTALKVSSTRSEQRLQYSGGQRRVGEHERKHCCHIRRDHAGAWPCR